MCGGSSALAQCLQNETGRTLRAGERGEKERKDRECVCAALLQMPCVHTEALKLHHSHSLLPLCFSPQNTYTCPTHTQAHPKQPPPLQSFAQQGARQAHLPLSPHVHKPPYPLLASKPQHHLTPPCHPMPNPPSLPSSVHRPASKQPLHLLASKPRPPQPHPLQSPPCHPHANKHR